MDTNADRRLIERAQSGDPSAYQELFKAYRPRVFRIVNSILKNSGDADDVVQDIFLILFGTLQSFRHQSSFFTWIYRIALNATRSWQTARNREWNTNADSGGNEIEKLYSPEDDQPEAIRARMELARMLDLAIARLPPSLREAFLLREIDDLSYMEIAEVTNAPLGTVRSRIARARSQLASSLAEQSEDIFFIGRSRAPHTTSRQVNLISIYLYPLAFILIAQLISL